MPFQVKAAVQKQGCQTTPQQLNSVWLEWMRSRHIYKGDCWGQFMKDAHRSFKGVWAFILLAVRTQVISKYKLNVFLGGRLILRTM